MEQSILKSVKKNLGVELDYNVFDGEIITYINTAFSTLNELGIGPASGFSIEDEDALWPEFLPNALDKPKLNNAKTYIYLRVRLLFDPPSTSYAITSFEKQVEELAWRLNVQREAEEWADPLPPVPVVIVDA